MFPSSLSRVTLRPLSASSRSFFTSIFRSRGFSRLVSSFTASLASAVPLSSSSSKSNLQHGFQSYISRDFNTSAPPAVEQVVILGSGAAGLTAAIYNARANLSPLVIDGSQPGGQLTITSDVENFPGFSDPIEGPKLMDTMRAQAERFGTRFVQATVTAVDLKSRPFTLTLSDDSVIRANSLIIATGAVAKWLDAPGEQKYWGRGVSACATCDGFFFRNKEIAVVGGGDTALEEATFLTRFAKKVTVIHRRDQLRASAAMQKKALNNPKIEFLWNSAVKEICGDEKKVTHLTIGSTVGEADKTLNVQGVFIAIGHQPNSKIFSGQLEMDANGYLFRQPHNTQTNVPGVFVAGDVSDHVYRQAITAAGMGCQAAIDAQHYLDRMAEEKK